MDDWTVNAPIIIIIVIAFFMYIAFRRASIPSGWYEKITKTWGTMPNWTYILLWFIALVLLTVVWYRANSIVTDVLTFDIINWLLVIHVSLLLAWAFFFFGDANVITGVCLVILTFLVLLPLFYYLQDDIINEVLFAMYTLWLFYVSYLTIGVLMRNKVQPGNGGAWSILPW